MKTYLLFMTEEQFLLSFYENTLPIHLLSRFADMHPACAPSSFHADSSVSVLNADEKVCFILSLSSQVSAYGFFMPDNQQFTFEHLLHPDSRITYPVAQLQEETPFFEMDADKGELLLTSICKAPDATAYYLTNQEHLQEVAAEQTRKFRKRKPSFAKSKEVVIKGLLTSKPTVPVSPHYLAQWQIKKIGEIVGMDNWIAKNDKNRIVHGEPLGSGCLPSFPDFQLDNEDFTNRFDLIDNIWFQSGIPFSFFEVEYTSSIMSGIIRMGDVISTIASSNPYLYIVAPRDRKPDVFAELNRPIFKKIGISNYVYFVAMEDIDTLYQKIKGLDGFIQPNIMQSIACQI